MVAPILMSVPAALQAAVEGGSAQVLGAIIKSVETGQILGHLQPTAALSRLAMSANPATLATQLGVEGLQSYQLLRVERLLDSLKVVSTVGAAASVLNLGVCLGGFVVLGALIGFGVAPTLVSLVGSALGGPAQLPLALALVGVITSFVAFAGFLLAARHDGAMSTPPSRTSNLSDRS